MSWQDHQIWQVCLHQADSSWQAVLRQGLDAVEQAQPGYLESLRNRQFLPTQNRLFAAFSLPFDHVQHVLIGEGPYPREQSATGFAFMDGAVASLWANAERSALSKTVNRATSLRNFIKMLLVAEGVLAPDDTGASAFAAIASLLRDPELAYIETGAELQQNFIRNGVLLLNASLVFSSDVAPAKDALAWRPFLQRILRSLQERAQQAPADLILWGKIAEAVNQIPEARNFPQLLSEHPYNLSFIQNSAMQQFFKPLQLLKKMQ